MYFEVCVLVCDKLLKTAQGWIETITKEPCAGPFGEALRNGVLLCKLVNCISPGSVKRVNESRMPFKQMENISNFLKARYICCAELHTIYTGTMYYSSTTASIGNFVRSTKYLVADMRHFEVGRVASSTEKNVRKKRLLDRSQTSKNGILKSVFF